jgi:Cu-Zn family superoxide dismutase
MHIDQSQITAWTFTCGQWAQVSPSPDENKSWCRAYFPHDYPKVKHELFDDASPFNGLYKHNDLFAIVYRPSWSGVAFFPSDQGNQVTGYVTFEAVADGVRVDAFFSQLPPGEHGFHIHQAGDLRAKGCQGACAHYHVGPPADHGGSPGDDARPRHTGDLGNVSGSPCQKTYELKGVDLNDLYGRSVIVHADPDDLGLGPHPDSKTTGHSGLRIACAIIGRVAN